MSELLRAVGTRPHETVATLFIAAWSTFIFGWVAIRAHRR